jgi:hypothetical protein
LSGIGWTDILAKVYYYHTAAERKI